MDATPFRESPVKVASGAGGRLRLLTLARPEKANAFDAATVVALTAGVDAAVSDGLPIAFMGEGRAFSGGFDFTGVNEHSEGDLLLRFVRIEMLLNAVGMAPVASFALVDGAAYGAAADLVTACTYRIGTAKAKFRFPGFRFGVALGTRRLAAVTGVEAARAILLQNRTIGAEEALDIGLLTHLVDEGDLLATAERLLDGHQGLSSVATARLLSLTTADTGDADLADLVRSLEPEGLHDRIARYRGEHR